MRNIAMDSSLFAGSFASPFKMPVLVCFFIAEKCGDLEVSLSAVGRSDAKVLSKVSMVLSWGSFSIAEAFAIEFVLCVMSVCCVG